MGRRRWKQYQGTLYNSTQSEPVSQPHHRLFPAFPTTCSNLSSGNVIQVESSVDQLFTGIQNQKQKSVTLLPEVLSVKIGDSTEKTINDELENHKNELHIYSMKSSDIKFKKENELTQNKHHYPQDNLSKQQHINENGDDESIDENCVGKTESIEKQSKLDDSILVEKSVGLLRNNLRQDSISRVTHDNDHANTEESKVGFDNIKNAYLSRNSRQVQTYTESCKLVRIE